MHPTLQDYYHLKIFMAIGEKEQSARILKRNGPVMHKVFLEKWIPLENEYFEKMKIKEKCDLIYSIP
jgi:uridine kinase